MDIAERLGLQASVVNQESYSNALEHLKAHNVLLPTFAELADPSQIPEPISTKLRKIDPDDVHPLNLFRVHWYNGADRRTMVQIPESLELPETFTGVPARIVVMLGNRFPMIGAHKVLAAYGCLVPRIITGQFDPTQHRAVWPSTGNYCRGGIAISRILSCRGVAVLPQGMSTERFEWLERWVMDPAADIVRTPGTESNVKEIYDKCRELAEDSQNVILNQFSEFGNYLVHYLCTGQALEKLFTDIAASDQDIRLAAFVAATGSAGTLGAGDYLKQKYGARIVVAEPLECPTLLYNGYGEHNIQGIGDKHVPLIHNVMNTDIVAAISDQQTDCLNVLFNTPAGKEYLMQRRGQAEPFVEALSAFGLSSICNVLAAIKTAKYLDLSHKDIVLTVATDGAGLYATELEKTLVQRFSAGFDTVVAGEVNGQHLLGVGTDHLLELTTRDRERIFNLGYYTWVEQQDLPEQFFSSRRHQGFWQRLHDLLPIWDSQIEELNARTNVRG
jgi:cysteine synthase